MNLSQVQVDLAEEKPEDLKPKLQAEEARLVRIIEALQGIAQTKEWSTLKTEVFDNLVNVLEKDLKYEAKKESPEPTKLNRLAGELKWAEKYSDLLKLENIYRVQLQNIRLRQNGKTDNLG